MVMEALPTPDAVGREFVRQYYTLLNEAPLHAHRFYNSNSYFVHGAMSKPAIGQRQIHQKIQQLNFRDCHAKISQVDSQATLGNGLVVQVSGELSNDGEPMRRFTQTFVLGTESPRKYYVHNDIFRYQDMLQSDEEADPPRDEDIEQVQDAHPDTQSGGNVEYFNTGSTAPVESQMGPSAGSSQNLSLNGTSIHEDALQGGQAPLLPPQEPTPAPVVNGRAVAEELKIINEDFILPSQTNVQQEMKSPKEKINHAVSSKSVEIEESAPVEQEASTINENESFSTEMMQDLQISAVSNEPKTYANLLKSDRMGSGLSSAANPNVMHRNAPVFNPPSGPTGRVDDAPQPPRPPRGPMRGVPTRGNRGDRSIGRSSFNDDGSALSGNTGQESQDRRRNLVQMQYSDNHQLFMGNLPLDATEDDLRELFSKYGTIADLHIHSKTSSGTKGLPGSRVPNYGFITFEDPQSVQEVLSNKPIFFPKEGGVKLNVEEKRVRPKSTLPSQGGGGGGGNAGGNESSWTSGRQSLRGGPPRGSRGGGARGNFNRDSRGPPVNQRSNFTQRR